MKKQPSILTSYYNSRLTKAQVGTETTASCPEGFQWNEQRQVCTTPDGRTFEELKASNDAAWSNVKLGLGTAAGIGAAYAARNHPLVSSIPAVIKTKTYKPYFQSAALSLAEKASRPFAYLPIAKDYYKLAAEKIGSESGNPERPISSIIKTLKNFKSKKFGPYTGSGIEDYAFTSLYDDVKQNALRNYLYGDNTGFEESDVPYRNLGKYEKRYGTKFKTYKLLEDANYKGGKPISISAFYNGIFTSPKYAEKFKDLPYEELPAALKKFIIENGSMSFGSESNPIGPSDIGGHMNYLDYDPATGKVMVTTQDIWKFSPKEYGERWGSFGKQGLKQFLKDKPGLQKDLSYGVKSYLDRYNQLLQARMMERAGTPFVQIDKRPIDFGIDEGKVFVPLNMDDIELTPEELEEINKQAGLAEDAVADAINKGATTKPATTTQPKKVETPKRLSAAQSLRQSVKNKAAVARPSTSTQAAPKTEVEVKGEAPKLSPRFNLPKAGKFLKGLIKEVGKQEYGGMITDPMGQWAHPGQNTRIPGGNITMQGVPYPVLGKANNGMTTMMYPGQDYSFPGADYVDEYPMMQEGGEPTPLAYSWLPRFDDANLSSSQKKVMNTISNLPIYSPDARWGEYQEALPYWKDNVRFTNVIEDQSNFGPNNSPSLGSYFNINIPSPYDDAWRSGNVYVNPSLFNEYDNSENVLEHELFHAGFNGRDVPQWMTDSLDSINRNPGSGEHQNMINEQLVNQAIARQSVLDEFGLEGNTTIPEKLSDEYLRRGMYSRMRNPNAPAYKTSVAEAISGNKPGSFNRLINYKAHGGLVRAQGGYQIEKKHPIDLHLPKYEKPKPFFTGYGFSQRPVPNVNVYGVGAYGTGNLNDRLNLSGSVNSASVFYPGGNKMFMNPNFEVGMKYKFQQGGGLTKYQSLGEVNEQSKDLPGVTIQAGKKTPEQKIADARAAEMDYQKGWYSSPMYKQIFNSQISQGEEGMMAERQRRLEELANLQMLNTTDPTLLGKLTPDGKIYLNVGEHDDPYVSGSQTLGETIGHEGDHWINNRGKLVPKNMGAFMDAIRNVDPEVKNKQYRQLPNFSKSALFQKELAPYAEYSKFGSWLAGQPIYKKGNLKKLDQILAKRNEEENWMAIPPYDNKKTADTINRFRFFHNYYNQPGDLGHTEYISLVNKIRQDAKESGVWDPFTEPFTEEIYNKMIQLGNTDKTRDFRQLLNWHGTDEKGKKKTIDTFNKVVKNNNKQTSDMARYGGGLDQYQTKGEVTYTHERGTGGLNYSPVRTVSPYLSNRDIRRYTQAPTSGRDVNFIANYGDFKRSFGKAPQDFNPTSVPYEGSNHWNINRFIVDPHLNDTFRDLNVNASTPEERRASILADMYKYNMLQDPEHKGRAFRKAKRFVRREIDPMMKGAFLNDFLLNQRGGPNFGLIDPLNTFDEQNPLISTSVFNRGMDESESMRKLYGDNYHKEDWTPDKLKGISMDYLRNYKKMSRRDAKKQWNQWEEDAAAYEGNRKYQMANPGPQRTKTIPKEWANLSDEDLFYKMQDLPVDGEMGWNVDYKDASGKGATKHFNTNKEAEQFYNTTPGEKTKYSDVSSYIHRYGGGLQQYQVAGQVKINPAIYTDDPKDPRFRSYNDSLNLYKQSLNNMFSEKSHGADSFYKNMGFVSFKDAPIELNFPSAFEKNDRFYPFMLNDPNKKNVIFNETIKPIGFNLRYETGTNNKLYSSIYKKPVQPYILKQKSKPQIKLQSKLVESTLKPKPFVPATKLPMGEPSMGMQIQQREMPNLNIPPVQLGKYKVDYFDPSEEDGVQGGWHTKSFMTGTDADEYMKQRNTDNKFYGPSMTQRVQYKNGGGLLSRTVRCSSCGHSWKGVDGGADVMTCHKCGGMIKMKQGGVASNRGYYNVGMGVPKFQIGGGPNQIESQLTPITDEMLQPGWEKPATVPTTTSTTTNIGTRIQNWKPKNFCGEGYYKDEKGNCIKYKTPEEVRAESGVIPNDPIDESLIQGSINSRSFLKNWYNRRAKDPRFTKIATARSKEVERQGITPITKEQQKKQGAVAWYDPNIPRNPNISVNIDDPKSRGASTQTHEKIHELDENVPQPNQDQIVQRIIGKNSKISGYSPGLVAGEIRARLNQFRRRYNLDPNKKYTPEEMQKIIDYHYGHSRPASELDAETQSGDNEIRVLLQALGDDPAKLAELNDQIVINQKSIGADVARFGGGIPRFQFAGQTFEQLTGMKPITSLNNVTDATGKTPVQTIQSNQKAQEIVNRNVATNKRQFLNQGQATTKESEARRKRLTQKAVAGLPNVAYDQQTGTTSAINPNMTYTGQPANFMGERQQKSVDHIMGALDAAGYLTGASELAGLGYRGLKTAIGNSIESGLLSKLDKKIYPTRAYRSSIPGGNPVIYSNATGQEAALANKIFNKGEFATKDLQESFQYLRGLEGSSPTSTFTKPGLTTGQGMNLTEYKIPFWKKNVSFDKDVKALKKLQGIDINPNEYIVPGKTVLNKLLYPRRTNFIQAVPEHLKNIETVLPSGHVTNMYSKGSIPLSARNEMYSSEPYRYIEDQLNAVTGHKMPITYTFEQSRGWDQITPITNWTQPQFAPNSGFGKFKRFDEGGDVPKFQKAGEVSLADKLRQSVKKRMSGQRMKSFTDNPLDYIGNVISYNKERVGDFLNEAGETVSDYVEGAKKYVSLMEDEDEKNIQETNKEKIFKKPVDTKSDVTFGYNEYGEVPDVDGKRKFAKFTYTFDNDSGARYVLGNKVKEVTEGGAKKHFTNVAAVAHFLRDSDILPNQKFAPNEWTVHGGNKFISTSPGRAMTSIGFDRPDWYRTLYKPNPSKPGEYLVKYVKNKEIDKNVEEKLKKEGWALDFTVSGQSKFSDVDWEGEGPSTKYAAKSKWLPLKNGDHINIPYKDKKGFSRFSGGSITYLFNEPKTGKRIGVDVAGSVNDMKAAGESLIQKYKLNPDQLEFVFHDMGSYSAKPKADKNNELDYDQWIDFNSYNRGFSGAPLMIPKEKYGGDISIPQLPNHNSPLLQFYYNRGGTIK